MQFQAGGGQPYLLGLDVAQVGHGAVIQPIEVAHEVVIVRWGGTASSPSSCCANRYFYLEFMHNKDRNWCGAIILLRNHPGTFTISFSFNF